jgi:hypothetical protein
MEQTKAKLKPLTIRKAPAIQQEKPTEGKEAIKPLVENPLETSSSPGVSNGSGH